MRTVDHIGPSNAGYSNADTKSCNRLSISQVLLVIGCRITKVQYSVLPLDIGIPWSLTKCDLSAFGISNCECSESCFDWCLASVTDRGRNYRNFLCRPWCPLLCEPTCALQSISVTDRDVSSSETIKARSRGCQQSPWYSVVSGHSLRESRQSMTLCYQRTVWRPDIADRHGYQEAVGNTLL